MTTTPINILLVEDDPADAVILKENLLRDGSGVANYNITHVQKLRDALDVIQVQDFSVILLDLNLPDVSGVDNIRCLREENFEIPVIVYSGLDSAVIADEALHEGAQDYLVKGRSDKNILQQAIKSSIARKDVHNELYRKAHFDEMTEMPNERLFRTMMRLTLQRAEKAEKRDAIMLVSAENYKFVKDFYGTKVALEYVAQVANLLRAQVTPKDMLARVADDCFAISLTNINDEMIENDYLETIERILANFTVEMEIENDTIQPDLKFGVAGFPENGHDFPSLYRSAEKALQAARHNHKLKYSFAQWHKVHSELNSESGVLH